ncbi:hypothetical protein TWF569_007144 [Orbilia oligospora]|uniref:Zn(2)-C6 fungal-type domain-containing protein n=1 Tax=Orbilia oligospora TaxID=2813651 RepID=A0A7C8JPW9_ORBOL|nr:hypothetical protein TWF706_011031 [Orbilia oligospora]KAF3091243.1 hypothetical protein TWF103_011728 [Orbilia oligospora]KAF3106955.1 hypothetical protein TWF102_000802 [Orbilia oligospora]KAF3129224.1 hypothetical protein TWF594_011074 [Orbilia oligospora]KAF3143975.1 hypothetical protein TWF569_007144 [Orbilia oligospora]
MDSTASISYERHSASSSYAPEAGPPPAPTELPPVQEHRSSPSSPPPGNIDPNLIEPTAANATAAAGPRPVRKRNRKALSCKPCRNMKVKCDRSMPCDRCVKNNRSGDCIYDGEPESKKLCVTGTYDEPVASKPQAASTKPTPVGPLDKFSLYVHKVGTAITHYKRGKARYVGGTHWVHMFGEFEEIGPWYIQRMKDFATSRREIKNLKKYFKNKNRHNFPFSSGLQIPLTINDIPSLLPQRHIADRYINRYLETFEVTHPLFHEPAFRRELDSFWQDTINESPKDAFNAVGPAWVGTLFMMMFLGCWFMPLSQETEKNRDVLERLLDGAQACMNLSSIRARNTVHVVRAYCMVVIAKQCDALSHSDSNVVSVTVAMITQIAMMAGIHRDPDHFKDMPPLEKFIRRRVWNTILYMNFQNSMDGGMPFLLGPNVYDCPAPLNQNDNDVAIEPAAAGPDNMEPGSWHKPPHNQTTSLQHPMTVVTDCAHQIILRSVLSIGTEIITPLNNANAEVLPYDAVMKYDYRLTRILDDLPDSLNPDRYGASGSRLDFRARLATQQRMIEFFIRSILLVLHRPYAQGPDSKEQYPNSYFAALKHATTFIAKRKQLSLDKSVNSVNGIWIAEVFKEMFTLSFLLCYADIRRRDNIDIHNDDKYRSILESQEMGEKEAVISEHHFQLFIATALKIPSLVSAKEGKAVIFSEEYVASLNDSIRNAAQKVRIALGLPPPDSDEKGKASGDGEQSTKEGAPSMIANSETVTTDSPGADITPDLTSAAARAVDVADLRDKPHSQQISGGGEQYGPIPSALFDSIMNDPNLMLDEFFTSFVFGGFQ